MLNDLLDEDGRPLGEHAVRPDPAELADCPYHDRRRGQPMNAAALRQVSSVWPSVRVHLGGAAAREAPTVRGVWRATAACVAAAPCTPAPIPRVLAALYKTSLGLNQALLQVLMRVPEIADAPAEALGGGDAFAAWCDREGLLFGARQVCAGAPEQIAVAWDALLRRSGAAPPIPLDAGRAFAELQALQLAFMATTYQAQRQGQPVGPLGARLLRMRPFAWLDCPPDRQPADLGRLFSQAPKWLSIPLDDAAFCGEQARLGRWLPDVLMVEG